MSAGDPYRDGGYLERNPEWHVADSVWKARHVLRLLERNRLRPRRVCEVGCGAGEVLRLVSEALPADARCDGFDISPQALELARGRGHERLHFHLGDPLDQPHRDFDVVLVLDVFEHVEDYLGFLRRLRGLGALTVFHIPLDLSAQSLLRVAPILELRRGVGHLHHFTRETALATLEHAGYEIVDATYTPGALENPKSVWARWARLPRRLAAGVSADLTARLLGGYSLLVLARGSPASGRSCPGMG